MRIDELLDGVPCRWIRGETDVRITGVTNDSRRVAPGAVFVAIRGTRDDGLRFVPEALARGAEVVVTSAGREKAMELSAAPRVIEVGDDRAALAVMARNLHGRVDLRVPVIGITGTNGKTTTCLILASILRAVGRRPGLLGTVTYVIGDMEIPATRTTPEAPDIQAYLERMERAGCGACVMEVSSHALDLRRVHGMRFAVAVFTNLTRDHLDYHQDMESYFAVKSTLFTGAGGPAPAAAVINIDDPYGARLDASLASRAGGAPRRITYGESASASIRIAALETARPSGLLLTLDDAGEQVVVRSPLAGRPNACNVTAAAAAARALGIGWPDIARGVGAVDRVPGRLERVGGRGFGVFVDYAHTDDALRNVLETVRPLTDGRVILVFGCGGDRDRTKRPLMGGHAARLADVVFVTSDNPRSEKPEAIIDEIMAGAAEAERSGTARAAGRLHAEPDRRRAIEAAIRLARPGDTVLIAGKGHETTQTIGDRVIPFDDRAVAREALGRITDEGRDGAP